jgi:hypothetical protein
MPTVGTPRSMKLSIWGRMFRYYNGGNKFLEIFVGARPPSSE